MSKGLEINVEIGLCTKDMAKENPIKDFEILIEEYKDKWSKQMYDYFKECLSIIEKELKDYYALKKECEEAKWYQEHKALEIIKEKNVWVYWLKKCKSLKEYNDEFIDDFHLAQEEYDLLKEVLL